MDISKFWDWLPGSLVFTPAMPSDDTMKDYL